MDREYILYRTADFLSHVLPRRFAYWIGLRVADRFYRRDAYGRSAVISNLRHILEFKGVRPSEETLEKLARRTFQYFGKYLVDFFRFTRMSRAEVDRIVSIEHPEYIDQARALGRGGLAVSAHLGSSEIAGAVVVALGLPLNAVVLPESDQKINALFQSRREGRGLKVIPLGHAARGTLKALKNKEWAALLADRDYSARNDLVHFFGAPARLPRGPVALCVKTGAPILPTFLLRQDDDTFLLRFHSPIIPHGSSSFLDIQGQICKILEQEIGERPSQWFMFEEFWKN